MTFHAKKVQGFDRQGLSNNPSNDSSPQLFCKAPFRFRWGDHHIASTPSYGLSEIMCRCKQTQIRRHEFPPKRRSPRLSDRLCRCSDLHSRSAHAQNEFHICPLQLPIYSKSSYDYQNHLHRQGDVVLPVNMDTEETNGPRIVISLSAVTGISLLMMILRFFCKARYTKRFGWDDHLLSASWVRLHSILVFLPPCYGLHKIFF
jgi:hypothetical protein